MYPMFWPGTRVWRSTYQSGYHNYPNVLSKRLQLDIDSITDR